MPFMHPTHQILSMVMALLTLPQVKSIVFYFLAYAGGSFVTETGLDLPSTAGGTPMWVGSLFQNQTLDRDYEERSQGVAAYENQSQILAQGDVPSYVLDNDLFQANLKDFTVPSKDKAVLSLAGGGLEMQEMCIIPDSINEPQLLVILMLT